MDDRLKILIEELIVLENVVMKSDVPEHNSDAHGWNQVHFGKFEVSYLIQNLKSRILAYGDHKITEGLDDTIDHHIENIKRLSSTARNHFNNHAQHLLYFMPAMVMSIYIVYNEIESELFSYENIEDKNLLPKNLSSKLRSTDSNIKNLQSKAGNLSEKIELINQAHDAANSLPTDLAMLQEAKETLNDIINSATSDLEKIKNEAKDIATEVHLKKLEAENDAYDTSLMKDAVKSYKSEARDLVSECDEALQIATTQGLAAGFDQKAKELRSSIWIWIIGLLLALVSGAFIGADRIDAFTNALNSQLSTGQALLHTVMSIFSIGGPLWLAWMSTQQINQRFKLSEDYSYKATVAKSFTGFKKHSERFDHETEKRLFNSTLDRLDEMPLRLIKDKDYNSPWHEFIDSEAFKMAIKLSPSLLSEASKFASKTKLKSKPKNKPVHEPDHSSIEEPAEQNTKDKAQDQASG